MNWTSLGVVVVNGRLVYARRCLICRAVYMRPYHAPCTSETQHECSVL